MIQALLPIVSIGAAFLFGCSSQGNPNSEKPERSDSKPRRPKVGDEVKVLPKQADKLGDYFISDENQDKQLDPGDLIFQKNAAHRYSVLDQNSAELQAFMKGLGHRPEKPLRLDGGVYAYLEVDRLPNVKLTALVGDSAVSLLISDYEKAEEYARANDLELASRAYLFFIRRGLEKDWAESQCPSFPSFESYLRWGCQPRLDQELENCRGLAAGLKTYAGIDNSLEIAAMEERALELKKQLEQAKIANRCGSPSDW